MNKLTFVLCSQATFCQQGLAERKKKNGRWLEGKTLDLADPRNAFADPHLRTTGVHQHFSWFQTVLPVHYTPTLCELFQLLAERQYWATDGPEFLCLSSPRNAVFQGGTAHTHSEDWTSGKKKNRDGEAQGVATINEHIKTPLSFYLRLHFA